MFDIWSSCNGNVTSSNFEKFGKTSNAILWYLSHRFNDFRKNFYLYGKNVKFNIIFRNHTDRMEVMNITGVTAETFNTELWHKLMWNSVVDERLMPWADIQVNLGILVSFYGYFKCRL
jgi:hypothetical protein